MRTTVLLAFAIVASQVDSGQGSYPCASDADCQYEGCNNRDCSSAVSTHPNIDFATMASGTQSADVVSHVFASRGARMVIYGVQKIIVPRSKIVPTDTCSAMKGLRFRSANTSLQG